MAISLQAELLLDQSKTLFASRCGATPAFSANRPSVVESCTGFRNLRRSPETPLCFSFQEPHRAKPFKKGRMMNSGLRRFVLRYRLQLCCSLTLLCFYAYFYSGTGWNQNSRFDLTRAIVEEHTIRIDSFQKNTGDKA